VHQSASQLFPTLISENTDEFFSILPLNKSSQLVTLYVLVWLSSPEWQPPARKPIKSMEDIMKFRLTVCTLLLSSPVILCSTPLRAAPVISELFYDASGSDAGLAFVELFGAPGESLGGLMLEGVNGGNGAVYTSITLSGIIPADGVFVIGDDAGGGMTSVPNTDLVADVDYQNGPDSVVLRDTNGVLDAVGYGNFGATDHFDGEGEAAPDPLAGSSIARINPGLDSQNNRADFMVLTLPTPGSVPSVSSVPVPAAIWLFGCGLVAVATVARRPV